VLAEQTVETRVRVWKYKSAGGEHWVFGYEPKRTLENGREGLVAFMSKEVEDTRTSSTKCVRVKTVVLRRRWQAKDRAYKWYCRKAGIPFTSRHRPRQLSPEQRAASASRHTVSVRTKRGKTSI